MNNDTITNTFKFIFQDTETNQAVKGYKPVNLEESTVKELNYALALNGSVFRWVKCEH